MKIKKLKETKWLRETFSENDNSANEYKKSLSEYLNNVLEDRDWVAMSDYTLYLQGAEQMLKEVLELLEA